MYALAAAPDGSPAAVCFQKGERPSVEHHPSRLRLEPAVLAT
ncbi:MAG: hypothetical protein ACO2PN_19255 [Pyrobaculum sp.]